MLLQHAIKYHEARNWICLQDPATLTYKTLLNHCKLLVQRCKQFRKAQQKGCAELTTLTTASTTQTSLHQGAITIQYYCYRCGYIHQRNSCPATGQRCHKCNAIGHFTTLCRTQKCSHRQSRHHHRRPRHSSRSSSRDSSTSPRRSTCSNSPARHNTHSQCRHKWSPTPYHIISITVTGPNAASNSDTEDKLVQLKKCKNRCPTPLPAKLFTFPTFSNTEDQIQHAMNYQYQTHHQKWSQTPGTDYYQRTYILIQISYHFKTILDALQDHLPTVTQKAIQRNLICQNTSQLVPVSYTNILTPH